MIVIFYKDATQTFTFSKVTGWEELPGDRVKVTGPVYKAGTRTRSLLISKKSVNAVEEFTEAQYLQYRELANFHGLTLEAYLRDRQVYNICLLDQYGGN